jgi:hypothetical protein
MTKLDYTLQKAVYIAKQRSEVERDRYRQRLESHLTRPEQLVFIDETHKSANASRRQRAWSKKGVTPVFDAFFEEEFRRRYTLIAACDIDGFVIEACKLVEREHGKNDRDPDRGTVDMERFEKYVEESLVPVLGKFYLDEPRSIVVIVLPTRQNAVCRVFHSSIF